MSRRTLGLALVAAALVLTAVLLAQREAPNPIAPGVANADRPADPAARRPVPVQILSPQRRDLAKTLTLPGNVAPWLQATLYAKVPGYLKTMLVDKGDVVAKGQLLAVIDAPEIAQQYDQAEADYRIKHVTYQRLHRAWKENPDVIAKQDVDVALAAAESAKHMMENRRTLMGYTKVYAPFSGVITARFADPGSFIQAAIGSASQSAPLYTIMDLDQVRVYVSVPQEAALLTKPGTPAVVTARELTGVTIAGSVTRTTEALDPATRTLLVEVDLPNPDHRLRPGMFVSITLTLQERKQAITVPPSALATGPAGERALFIVEDGVARRIPIEIGLDDGLWVEVTKGLTGTEQVVVVGKTGLDDGQAVEASPYALPAGKPARQKL